ncbi:MAG TPA: sugar-binding protein [Bacteroidota bacterium]|nr:sugar-binding protein [Bacteroidota bacterium]
MMQSVRFWCMVVIMVLMGDAVWCAETPEVHAMRIDGNLKLSGKLEDPRWKLAQPVWMAFEIQPGENTPAPQRTQVRVLYNADYVYFGFDCSDSNTQAIRAHITDRDKIFDDDFVGIILDTYGDFQHSYEFFVNPYGIQADLMRSGNNEDDSFDTIWESAASMNGSGWTAEMAIPLKSLRFPSRKEQEWRVVFGRIYPRESRSLLSWTTSDRNNPCFACQGGKISGIHDIESVTSVDVLPYVAGQQSGALRSKDDPASGFENGKFKGRIGGGLRYAPTPDLAIEGVVNPDFSQVESDAAQISVNSTFALFYPEKRPFFLEGSDMLKNQTQTFYSRTINNPIASGRVHGKSGSLSYVYLAASDRNTPYIIPGEEKSDFISTDIASFSNIARARYDFGKETFIGAIATMRNAHDSHNYVAGIDWGYRFWGSYSFNGELFFSDTKEVNDTTLLASTRTFGSTTHTAAFNGEQFAGTAAQITLRRDARDFSFNAVYQDRSPLFQAHSGFVPSNNTRVAGLYEQYTFYPSANSVIDQVSIQADEGLHFNYDGRKKEEWLLPQLWAQFKGQTNVGLVWFLVNNEMFNGVQFNNINRVECNINSRPISALALFFNGSFGRFINRTDAPSMGTGHTISLTAQIRPTPRFQVELSYSRARLSSVATNELFYDGYIARTVGAYQFTPEMFVRVIGQYDQFNKALEIYPLFSYKLSPLTIFYAGSTYALTDFGKPYGMRDTARQYFIKIQYLFRT